MSASSSVPAMPPPARSPPPPEPHSFAHALSSRAASARDLASTITRDVSPPDPPLPFPLSSRAVFAARDLASATARDVSPSARPCRLALSSRPAFNPRAISPLPILVAARLRSDDIETAIPPSFGPMRYVLCAMCANGYPAPRFAPPHPLPGWRLPTVLSRHCSPGSR